jgi:3-oxoacyl-[acyl-carrier-protein] synthase II
MPNRVVITGYGAITPLGLNVKDTWHNLINGTSGIDHISLFDASDLIVKIAAEVKNFNPLDYLDPTTARYMDRFAQFAVAASLQAIEGARLKIDDSNRYDIGILIGSGVGGISSLEKQLDVLRTRGAAKVSPYIIPMMILDNAPGQITIKTGIKGPNLSVVSSCSTGTDAVGLAYQMIKCDQFNLMIAGGTDAAVTPMGVAGFTQAGALSRNQEPRKASRPFDAQRDGFVIGEGAAVLVLESLDYAVSRGADILAEIVGYGATSDAYHITQPSENSESAVKAIELALANIEHDEVDYINAHGTSTPLNDLSETRAIKKVFNKKAYQIPTSSIKSMVGHMLGAAGALEAIICCQVINEGIIPPTINLENPDPDCDLDYVPNTARTGDVRLAISNSFGFGGHNSVLAIRRYSGH